MKIAILGYGTVGSGLIDLIENNASKRDIEVVGILVKNKEKHKYKKYFDKITTDIEDIFDKDIDILVEVIGGLNPAFDYVTRALNKKIHVVTANKDLLAEKGSDLIELANLNDVSIKFEASVAGGIPVLKPLIESLEGNNIKSINAILNGTCNFILSKMYDENLPYDVALKQAQELGFAEVNPDADVLGYDSARKLSILSTLSYGKIVYWKDLLLEGITSIDEKDIEYAKKLNCKIKLVARSKYESGEVSGFVRPALVDDNNMLSKIDNEFNVVILVGDSVGELSFVGKGAGRGATGSAVYADIIDIIDNRNSNIKSFSKGKLDLSGLIEDECSAVVRFGGYNNKDGILGCLDKYVDDYDIIDDEELAIFVSAKSEHEIDRFLEDVKRNNYSESVKKLLKID
ncbi:homoserine dehydrogenase [Clostridioides difficile]|uniref:Homoserine dehydrogenase n=2 Tax=Clostridioides difficile TaxID=1496 RepID=A0AAX3GW94_CLODI|nr:homoserine dehydrogenase [Clostridioides difficile]AVD35674.1 homoserine dehydrogenase [Clostridioides difficile]AVD40880.1 homoserine dehydrogenase [Clostridioides difficile]AVD44387.1 homoserine dehydrogenase [Clostridioides difficile]AXU67493.1 homoserine dehydrogenase [Clostridioides difficile]AXU89664.1 homoserine dehydrogenase [Clostridioides difficile]